jgi:hypothetical protein
MIQAIVWPKYWFFNSADRCKAIFFMHTCLARRGQAVSLAVINNRLSHFQLLNRNEKQTMN